MNHLHFLYQENVIVMKYVPLDSHLPKERHAFTKVRAAGMIRHKKRMQQTKIVVCSGI